MSWIDLRFTNMTTAPTVLRIRIDWKGQEKNHRDCGDYDSKSGKRLIVACSGEITSEDNNKGLNYGYILRVESKLFAYALDAERWVWEHRGNKNCTKYFDLHKWMMRGTTYWDYWDEQDYRNSRFWEWVIRMSVLTC